MKSLRAAGTALGGLAQGTRGPTDRNDQVFGAFFDEISTIASRAVLRLHVTGALVGASLIR